MCKTDTMCLGKIILLLSCNPNNNTNDQLILYSETWCLASKWHNSEMCNYHNNTMTKWNTVLHIISWRWQNHLVFGLKSVLVCRVNSSYGWILVGSSQSIFNSIESELAQRLLKARIAWSGRVALFSWLNSSTRNPGVPLAE